MALVEKLKRAEGQIAEGAPYIRSLQRQLSGIDARIVQVRLQAIADFKESIEYTSRLKQMFVSGSKSFQDKCREVGLDLMPIDEPIKRSFGNESSSKVSHALGARDDPERADAELNS